MKKIILIILFLIPITTHATEYIYKCEKEEDTEDTRYVDGNASALAKADAQKWADAHPFPTGNDTPDCTEYASGGGDYVYTGGQTDCEVCFQGEVTKAIVQCGPWDMHYRVGPVYCNISPSCLDEEDEDGKKCWIEKVEGDEDDDGLIDNGDDPFTGDSGPFTWRRERSQSEPNDPNDPNGSWNTTWERWIITNHDGSRTVRETGTHDDGREDEYDIGGGTGNSETDEPPWIGGGDSGDNNGGGLIVDNDTDTTIQDPTISDGGSDNSILTDIANSNRQIQNNQRAIEEQIRNNTDVNIEVSNSNSRNEIAAGHDNTDYLSGKLDDIKGAIESSGNGASAGDIGAAVGEAINGELDGLPGAIGEAVGEAINGEYEGPTAEEIATAIDGKNDENLDGQNQEGAEAYEGAQNFNPNEAYKNMDKELTDDEKATVQSNVEELKDKEWFTGFIENNPFSSALKNTKFELSNISCTATAYIPIGAGKDVTMSLCKYESAFNSAGNFLLGFAALGSILLLFRRKA